MAMTIHVDIVSAEKEIFSGTAEMVFAPAAMGEVGIAPRHTQMLTPLKAGEVRVRTHGDEERMFYVSGGMLEVQPHMVTILADTAVRYRLRSCNRRIGRSCGAAAHAGKNPQDDQVATLLFYSQTTPEADHERCSSRRAQYGCLFHL